MCGRTAQGLPPSQIQQELERTLPRRPEESWIDEDRYRTSYNVTPTRYQPVVRAEGSSNQYVVHMMRWGLIPHYTKTMPDYNSVLKSINARDDSLFAGPTCKSMFNHSKNYKRCIVLAEGFYEWRRRGKDRVPFYTKRKDGCLMLMAAIYDVAQIQGEPQPLYTYATITTNASKQLEWLHDRMPVLIPNHEPEKIKAWLDPKVPWNSTLESMLKPCDEYLEAIEDTSTEVKESDKATKKIVYALETYQVDEKVNSVKNDSPDFAKPWNSSSNKKTLNRFFMPGTAIAPDDNKSKDPSTQSPAVEHPDSTTEKPASSPKSDVTTTSPKIDNLNSTRSRRVIKMESDDEDEGDLATGVAGGEYRSILAQLHPTLGGQGRSEPADFDQSDGGLEQKHEGQRQKDNSDGADEEEDEDLKLALEASRREHEMNTSFSRSQSPPLFLTSGPDEPAPSTSASSGTPPPSASGAITPKHTALSSSSSSSSSGRSPLKVDSRGTVDLLEKRKADLKQEEDEMKQVLELSRLQAIADGHDDPSLLQESATLSQQSQVDSLKEQERRKEQEDLDRAIAASLQGPEEGQSTSPRTRATSESSSSFLSQQSTASNSSSASGYPASPSPKKSKSRASIEAPSPKKRGNSGPVSSPASKKNKPNQASITSFFQQK
ncbi:hypothetical protein EMPS_07219 [Entomortierella parvispora]|uniref:DUF159-domain-containing protein n=1 Tax=Entomortierella parvispora TaxID=205924 RepID=A0A9P3LXZ7_9FUNG|nr:hypothetical protein EMPS_07219 [Entomortierella parvispora]